MSANRPPEDAAEILPHFQRTEKSPRLPERAGEIALAADAPRVSSAGPTWPLWGSFRLSDADAADESVLRRIVLALTSDASHVTQARHVIGDTVLFSGDVTGDAPGITGYFNVDLADLFDLPNRQETFHIVASIGAHTSDVLTYEAEFPWVDFPSAEPQEGTEGAGEEEDGKGDDEEDGDDSWMMDDDPEMET